MSRWQEVYDLQLDLLGKLTGPVEVAKQLMAFRPTATTGGYSFGPKHDFSISEYSVDRQEAIRITLEALKLKDAEPIYVSPEMSELFQVALETFRPEPLLPTDMPTAAGFMLLPKPVFFPDVYDRQIPIRALLWAPFTRPTEEGGLDGIHVSYYDYVDDLVTFEPGDHNFVSGQTGDDISSELVKSLWPDYIARRRKQAPWECYHQAFMAYGSTDEAKLEIHRSLLALFRLCMQTIADHRLYRAPRGSRRRWQRHRPGEPKDVTVITLRRPKHASQGPEKDVAWSHRWLVRGFWRNQWYPSEQRHRQIWISDYIKGPDGAPLRIRKLRAFELTR